MLAAISATNPIACWDAADGWRADGALRCGYMPDYGYFPNYVKSSAASFATSGTIWSACITFNVEGDTSRLQTVMCKADTGKNEFKAYIDTDWKLKLRIYSLDGSSTTTVSSGVTVSIGTTYRACFGYNGTQAWIQVNSETIVTASVGFTPGSSDSPWCLGYHIPQATFNNFWGTLDSAGWAPGYTFSGSDITTINAGVVFADLSGAMQAHFSDWYDFGNGTTYNSSYTEWDWLMSSTGSGNSLTQVSVGHGCPYVVPGLNYASKTTDVQSGVLWTPDATNNGYYALQPWRGLSIGFHSQEYDGTPAYFFRGDFCHAHNYSTGGVQFSYPLGPTFSGTNVPYSFAGIAKYQTNRQFNQQDEVLGNTLCGLNSIGWVPWDLYGQNARVPQDSGCSVKFSTSEFYNPSWSAQVGSWAARRQADNNTKNQQAAATKGNMPRDWFGWAVTFNGQYTKLWIEGTQIFSLDQLNENTTGNNTPLAAISTRCVSFGGGCYGRDELAFNPPYDSFSGGGWSWSGWMKAVACYDSALSDAVAERLSVNLKPARRVSRRHISLAGGSVYA